MTFGRDGGAGRRRGQRAGVSMDESDEIIAVVEASVGRRVLGIGSLWGLAILLVYVALAQPPELGWQVFLLVTGAGSAWMAEQMRRATALRLELTMHELRDSGGTQLCRVDEVASMERGMFAFKPSNGFLLNLAKPRERNWRPGLWWRLGRRVGVGGMTPGHQAKAMAEVISAMVAEREASGQ